MPQFDNESLFLDLSNRKLKRYEWEDRLIYLCKLGLISSGSLNICLRLASAMNWKLGGELRWDNDSAFFDVGVGRSTFYGWRNELLASGVLSKKGNNYVASLPKRRQAYEYEIQVEGRILKKLEKSEKRASAIKKKRSGRENWLKQTQESGEHNQ